MVDKTSIKTTQIFGWDSEPKSERKSVTGAMTGAVVGAATGAAVVKEGVVKKASAAKGVDWRVQRQAPNERDLTLSFVAVNWEKKFEPADRPTQLCARYPRVANRLALCWPDTALTLTLLESLLVDKRGTRQGFPAPVTEELNRLRRIRPSLTSA